MIDPGRLRDRVTIEAVAERTADGRGGYTETWREILGGTVWAEVTETSGTERTRARQVSASATHRVLLRYREELTAAMRAIWGERTLLVIEPPRPVEGEPPRSWMQLICREAR